MFCGLDALTLNLNPNIFGTEGSVEDYEEFISKYEDKELHPNHYHLVTAKHSLMQMLGRNEGYLIQDMPMNLVIDTISIKEWRFIFF